MMPSMPSMPQMTDSAVNSAESLDTPSHDDVMVNPEIINPDLNINTQVSVPHFITKGIEVVATRKGFYNQMRLKEGDKFTIRSFEEIGEWFKCVDPSLEKKRLEFLKHKKAKK